LCSSATGASWLQVYSQPGWWRCYALRSARTKADRSAPVPTSTSRRCSAPTLTTGRPDDPRCGRRARRVLRRRHPRRGPDHPVHDAGLRGMMPRVVGLDLSLTCTGIGILTQTKQGVKLSTGTATSTGKRAASLVDRHSRLTTLGADIMHHARGVDLAVIEGPTPGVKGASPIDRHALWWFVVGGLIRREVPVAVVSPTALKPAIAVK